MVWGFTFAQMEQVDKAEQSELLELGKSAAQAWEFDKAEGYLEQAKNKGYNPKEIAVLREHITGAKEAKAKKEEEERQAKLEAERRERETREAQARRDASGNAGGSLNCSSVSSNYALWNYCQNNSCDGFSSNYGLWNLCKNDDISGLSSNYAVWSYLKNGDTGGFGSDYNAYTSAKENAGSFADRKRWVIYYLHGYTYQ
jgi:hypothetical protein